MTLDLDFTATVKDIDIEGINKFLKAGAGIDIEVGHPEATVKFSLEPDAREYGIKSMSIIVKTVTAEINWWAYTDDLTPDEKQPLLAAGGIEMVGDTIDGKILVNSEEKQGGKEWVIDSEMRFSKDGSLMVDVVNINLFERTITVSSDNNND